MSAGAPSSASAIHHSEHLADRAAMLAMRTMIRFQPPADLGPAGCTAFDELMTKTPSRAARSYTFMKDPRASPLYADLAGMPPIQFHVGEDEILLDDARRQADLLAKAGVAAELHVWQSMVHVFPASLALVHAAREALYVAGAFLRRKFAHGNVSHPVLSLPHSIGETL
jgi:acetyl esterase/lipase